MISPYLQSGLLYHHLEYKGSENSQGTLRLSVNEKILLFCHTHTQCWSAPKHNPASNLQLAQHHSSWSLQQFFNVLVYQKDRALASNPCPETSHRAPYMLKHPWHFTSMKNEFGEGTSLFILCFFFSHSAGGFSKSISLWRVCDQTTPNQSRQNPPIRSQHQIALLDGNEINSWTTPLQLHPNLLDPKPR